MEDELVHEGKLGNWIAMKLSAQKKKIAITNIHRIPASTSNGNKCSLTQCNLVDGKAKKPSQCRKEILKETQKHVEDNQDIDNTILTGDFNQDIASNEVHFFTKLGLQDLHSKHDTLGLNELHNACVYGHKPID